MLLIYIIIINSVLIYIKLAVTKKMKKKIEDFDTKNQ